MVGVVVLGSSAFAWAQEQAIRFRSGDYSVFVGARMTLPVELNATQDGITGFSFGIRHDPNMLTVLGVAATQEFVDAGADPDSEFFFLDTAASGGDGIVVAVILTADGSSLDTGVHHLFDVEYEAAADADGTTTVRVTDQLGDPQVPLVIDVDGGTTRTFEGSSEEIAFSDGFRRGDADGSGGSINIRDPLIVLFFLFRGQQDEVRCPPALNFDGSFGAGTPGLESIADIAITDAILLLRYLFANGVDPAPPFPQCGAPPNPLAKDAACMEFNGCP